MERRSSCRVASAGRQLRFAEHLDAQRDAAQGSNEKERPSHRLPLIGAQALGKQQGETGAKNTPRAGNEGKFGKG